MDKIIERSVAEEIKSLLSYFPAVGIVGPARIFPILGGAQTNFKFKQ